MIDQQASSNGDSVPLTSELGDLIRRIAELDKSIVAWNNVYLFCLAATAVFGALVVIAEVKVIAKQRLSAQIQAEVFDLKEHALRGELHTKDLHLRRELHEKDLAIAGEMKEKDVKIGEAAGIAATANERSVKLELEVATQQERAAKAEKELLDAQKVLAAESIAVQQILKPRMIPSSLGTGDASRDAVIASKYDALNEFAGMSAIIFVSASDSEAQTFAKDLFNVLSRAKWVPEIRDGQRRIPGIAVFASYWPPKGPPAYESKEWRAGEAVSDLIGVVFQEMKIGTGWPIPAQTFPEDRLPLSDGVFSRPRGVVAVVVGANDTASQLLTLEQHRWIREQAKAPKEKK